MDHRLAALIAASSRFSMTAMADGDIGRIIA
jgi:hypothetical protein